MPSEPETKPLARWKLVVDDDDAELDIMLARPRALTTPTSVTREPASSASRDRHGRNYGIAGALHTKRCIGTVVVSQPFFHVHVAEPRSISRFPRAHGVISGHAVRDGDSHVLTCAFDGQCHGGLSRPR